VEVVDSDFEIDMYSKVLLTIYLKFEKLNCLHPSAIEGRPNAKVVSFISAVGRKVLSASNP